MNFDTVLLCLIFILFAITVFFMVPTFQFTKKLYNDYPSISKLIFGSLTTVTSDLNTVVEAANKIDKISGPMTGLVDGICSDDGITASVDIGLGQPKTIKFGASCKNA